MRPRPLLCAVVVLFAALPAASAWGVTSLHDVWFQIFWEPQPESRVTGSCDPVGQTEVHFVVEGIGQGSLGGLQAREEGTINIGPHELAPIADDDTHWNGTYGLPSAQVMSWESTFTLKTGDGTTVTGTRSGEFEVPYDVGLCNEFDGTPYDGAGHATFGYRKYARVINLPYEATFTSGGSTTTETGSSEVNLREAHLDGAPSARIGQYRTAFAAKGEEPVAEPEGTDADDTVTTDEEPNGFGPGGDGAIEADPIEATIDAADEGETTVSESDVEGARAAARRRFRTLGQKVRIRTPRRAAAARVTFEIDSTARRSAGPRKLVVRRNGKTLKNCSAGGSPCVEKRLATWGDDATLVVRGRALAGTYTFLAPRR